MTRIFENATMLLPGRRVATGDIVVERGKIAALRLSDANNEATGPRENAETIDCSGKLVMPGLVNSHGHTPMTLLRGVGGGLPLQRWLEEAIFPVEAKMKPEDIAAGMTWGAMEMLAGGTTCVGEMYDFPEAEEEALRATGMKGNICRVGLAFADNVPPNRLAECIDYCRGEVGAVDGTRPQIARDFCIHSEYLTNEKFCRELAAANKDLKRPLNVHVSETKKEHDECIARHGKTPIAYLASTGLLDFGGYAAHCVWCTDDDFRIMREMGVSLVHNPTSNMKLGSGFARIPAAMALGVNIALGTDGCASNDNLDMFEEMHLASLIHKGLAQNPTVLAPWDIIEMATVNGAKALGRTDSGEIAVGKCADLCIVDLNKVHLKPANDLANLVVHSMHASDVAMTVVDGEIAYDRGHWPMIDDGRAEFEFNLALRRLQVMPYPSPLDAVAEQS